MVRYWVDTYTFKKNQKIQKKIQKKQKVTHVSHCL